MGTTNQTAVTTFSVWDGDWAVLEEYTTGNVLVEKYLQGYHGLVKTLTNNIYYYQDELGSTSHVANASGALLEYYKYDLYGKPTYWNASSPSSQLPASAYGVKDLHGGARWIPELGLYDDRNRFMSPDLGRFLQPDPIGFKGDASNLYRYCGNDWANKTDLLGLESVEPHLIASTFEQQKMKAPFQSERGSLLSYAQINKGTIQFFQAVNNFIQSARPDAAGVDPKTVGAKGYADAKEDAKRTGGDIKYDAAGRLGREYITAELAKNGKLTTDGPHPGQEPSRGESQTTAEFLSKGTHPLVLTHSHGPQSNPYHEGRDKPSAEGRLGNTPYISFLAHSSQPGNVQAYVPSPNPRQRNRGAGGSFFHSTDGANWDSGQ